MMIVEIFHRHTSCLNIFEKQIVNELYLIREYDFIEIPESIQHIYL